MTVQVLETALHVGGEQIALRLVTPSRDGAGSGAQASKSPAPGFAALLVHGRTSNQAAHDAGVADTLAEAGLTALSLDLPGHGQSTGQRDEVKGQLLLDAVMAAYDYLQAVPGVHPLRIVGVGSSLGAYLLTRLSALRPLAALALRVPANFPDHFDTLSLNDAQVAGPEAVAWRSVPRAPGETAAMRALAAFGGPVLIVEAEADTAVPHQSVMNLARSVNPALLQQMLIRNAPHVLYSDPHSKAVSDAIVYAWVLEQAEVVRRYPSVT